MILPNKLRIVLGLVIFLLLVFLFGLAIYELTDSDSDQSHSDELIFAHTLCRHGDRNAYIFYPTDPWKSEVFWPGGYAQLTQLGKQQHYDLGKYFRKRYAKLIGNEDIAFKIYVQSTNKSRTVDSARANLAGLFSSDGTQKSNNSIGWESVPIQIIPLDRDYILASQKKCDHYDYLLIEYQNSAEYKALFEKYDSLIKYLEENSGEKIRTLSDVLDLWDTLFVEKLKNYTLPSWAEKVMIPGGDFEYFAWHWNKVFTTTTEMKKLKSGFLLKDIFDRFTNRTHSIQSKSTDPSLWMFFAHDITVSNMLNSLGLFKLHQPPYSSCIFFELYKGNETPYVQIFYKNSTDTNIPALEIPNCGTKCPLNKMYELYDAILPKKSYEAECKLRDGESLTGQKSESFEL